MKPLRRILPYLIPAVFAIAIAVLVVWWRQTGGPERVTGWWQAWRDHRSLNTPEGRDLAKPVTLEALPPELRERVDLVRRDPAAVLNNFQVWRQRYISTPPGPEREGLVDEGVALARERRTLLREVIALDPQLALRLAVPANERAWLPEAVVAQLENPVSGRGDFRVVATLADPAAEAEVVPVRREAVVDGRTYDAFVYGRRARLASRQNIGLHGIALDGRLALLDTPVRVLAAGEAPAPGRVVEELCVVSGLAAGPNESAREEPLIAADTGDRVYYLCSAGHIALLEDEMFARENGDSSGSAAPALPVVAAAVNGTKRVLVIRVRFQNDAANYEPQTEASVRDMFTAADAFMRENSYGAVSLTPVITPVYTLPQSATWYKNNDSSGYALNVLQAARAIAANPTGTANAGLAAYNYLDFDFEAVRYNGGPGNFSGQAYVGTRGCWIKNSSGGVLAHELGHNFGLWHANFWEVNDPEAPTGPGLNREYGDDFDTMGRSEAGARHFNAAEKALLGWLPEEAVASAFVSGIHRIYAHDAGTLVPERHYALRVPRAMDRYYWFEFRQHPGWANNAWMQAGLGARWDAWLGSNGGTQLLDTTPGSAFGKDDSPIVVGRTYSDPVGEVHITPLRRNTTVPASLDVDVQIGPFPSNRHPTLQVSASATQVAAGTDVRLTAAATDADGDELAFAWDCGDDSVNANAAEITHRWSAPGDYRVRVVVSDRKGGTASASVVVRVGVANGSRVRGTIVDLDGRPVPDVRVATDLGVLDVNYREALTDSNGAFTLTNVANGTWRLVARKAGWAFAPTTFTSPLTVAGDAQGINFLGRPGGWRVSGVVRHADGSPVAGALVTDGVRTEPTDEQGAFAFVGVPAGMYTLQVNAGGARFDPVTIQVESADLEVPTITETTFMLAGQITGAGTTPVTITDGWRVTTATVTGSGAYARQHFLLEGVPAGTWQLRASSGTRVILPLTFSNPLTVTGDRYGLDFTADPEATQPAGVIRGRVLDAGAAVADAVVQAGGVSVVTDCRGAYQLAGIPAGRHVVSVSAFGRTFVPATREVTVATGEVSGVDFTAKQTNSPPVFTQPARTSGSLNRPFIVLRARATDDGGDNRVRYTWSVVGTAPGEVTFSVNAANGAAETVAQFSAAGSYRIRVTASDALGASASSETTVTIGSAPVRMEVVPATLAASMGEPVALAVQCFDQFGGVTAANDDVTWSVDGGGTITSNGVFTGTTAGRGFVATARMGTLSAACVIDVGYARGPGHGLTQERWLDVSGTSVRQLTALASYPGSPTYVGELDGDLEITAAAGGEADYGQRLRGFFVPPASGDYVFQIAANSAAELWVSSTSDPVGRRLLASCPVAVGERQWNALPNQRSAPLRLTKDVPVYLEVLHKVGSSGGGHLSVSVDLPGGVFEGPIPGHRLLPWGTSVFEPPEIVSPARATPPLVGSELVAQLDVLAASEGGEGALTYTWSVSGTAPGPVVFLPNGTNAAKSTTARFVQPGAYTLVVAARDAAGQQVTSSVVVSVAASFSSWQRTYFSAAELDDPTQEDALWGAEADSDGDGLTNLLEYAFGFDPRVAEADAEPRPMFVTVGGVRYLAITFRRNRAATDVIFTPQATSDLRTWEVGLVPVGDPDGEIVTYRDFAPAENFEQRFLRVQVSLP